MYNIYRYYQWCSPMLLRESVTLEEAREWCSREDTHGDGWFDGYVNR